MVDRGELRRLHRGVFLVGPIATPRTYEMAAVLACGGGVAISHRSAAHLLEYVPYPAQPGPVHVTVPSRHRRGDGGIVVHKTETLAHYEIRDRHGIPVTAPIRTLIDFAGDDASDEEFERAVAEAFALGETQRGPLLREVERQRGRRGTARLRSLLDGDGPNLVVEVDAYSTHSSPTAFERDRRKTAELEDLGFKVRRITKARIDSELAAVVAEVQRLTG